MVTGGAGFIGCHLIGKLLPSYKVVCVDNFNDYYNPEWKKENIKKFEGNDNFQLHQVDIRQMQKLENDVFAKYSIDIVVHLAARAGVRPSIENPILYEEVNVGGTLKLLELIKKYKIGQFIFASSSSVYGNLLKSPFSENDSITQPISPYAATKIAAEALCFTYAHLYKIKTTCLRFFTVYGPCGRPDMAPYLFVRAITRGEQITRFGDGSSLRDYTYIDDIVEGIVAAVESPFDFEVINLGSNRPISLNDFIAAIEKATGNKANLLQLSKQPGDVRLTFADVSKARKLLNWTPTTRLDEGLKQFVSWYRKNRL